MLTSCGEIAPEQPNILIFVVSSLRADALGTYDLDRTETPHFDELAIDGVTFEEAYATSSWDRPALTSLLSGLYPWHHGVNAKEDSLDPSMPSIARAFSKDGYASALITANPNVGPLFGLDEGFDETIELYSRSQPGRVEPHEFIAKAKTVVEVALKWMEERPRPYFLVVLAIDPRAPYLPSRSDDPACSVLAAESMDESLLLNAFHDPGRRMMRLEFASSTRRKSKPPTRRSAN